MHLLRIALLSAEVAAVALSVRGRLASIHAIDDLALADIMRAPRFDS